jgi:hypothetical protein
MAPQPIIATLFLALALTGIGALTPWPDRAPGQSRAFGALLAAATGTVGFYLLLLLAELFYLRWSRVSIVILLGLAAAAAIFLRRRRSEPSPAGPRPEPPTWRWGEATAVAALLIFTALALSLWITTPDFIYHWGLKGERVFAQGGIDFADLAQRWNEPVHPDYPNLLPTLYGASALLAGRFDAPALMLWSTVFFGFLLIAGREALARSGSSPAVTQAALALFALVVGSFAIGSLMAGGADWIVALALVAAIPALTQPPSASYDSQLGVLAALSAAAKVEGAALAGILLFVQWCRLGKERFAFNRLAILAGPTVAVVLPWQECVRHFRLFQQFNAGHFEPSRWPRVAAALGDTLSVGSWHGFAWALLLVPLIALRRSLRPLAAVLMLQLGFYLYVYLSVGIEPVPLVLASFPRLVFQLLPATLVGLVLAGFAAPAARTAAVELPARAPATAG